MSLFAMLARLSCNLSCCCQSLKGLAHSQRHLPVNGTEHRRGLSACLDGAAPPIVAHSLHGLGLSIFTPSNANGSLAVPEECRSHSVCNGRERGCWFPICLAGSFACWRHSG